MRTRSRGVTNYYALLAEQYNKSEHNTKEHSPMATPVLDATTGAMLEHRQLRRHPAYKETWDESYANELRRLCQGIGTNPTNPTNK